MSDKWERENRSLVRGTEVDKVEGKVGKEINQRSKSE